MNEEKKQGIPVNIQHVAQAYGVDLDECEPGRTYQLATLMVALGFMNVGRPKGIRERNKN